MFIHSKYDNDPKNNNQKDDNIIPKYLRKVFINNLQNKFDLPTCEYIYSDKVHGLLIGLNLLDLYLMLTYSSA